MGRNPETEEDQRFAEAMQGVKPLAPDPQGRHAPTPQNLSLPRKRSSDAEAYAELCDLVVGSGSFDIADSDEYIEGTAPGIDRRLLKKLRKGDYAIEGHLDLHGLSAEEARLRVERFISESIGVGKRCVLIIHGRGLNSKEGIPVLKERMKVWLTRGRIARSVLTFCTARPPDGGAGALYLLLRRS